MISRKLLLGLGHRNALAPDFLGQARLDPAQAVLDVDLGEIDVGPPLEGHSDRRGPLARGRAHVEKVFDPVQSLLDDQR